MSIAAWVSLLAMSAFYVLAGINHFRMPEFYLKLMPPYLPAHAELVFLSGLAEVVLGAALLVPALRVWAAWGVIALLVAVFPANIHAAVHDVLQLGERGLGWLNWVRLPLQALLIAWAWWHTQVPAAAARAGS